MKLDRLFTRMEAAVTGFFLSFSAMACLVTAFSMTQVSLWLLALYCAIGAVVCALLCTRRLGLLVWGMMILGAIYLWQDGILEQSAESLLYTVSRVYHSAYNLPIIRWGWRTADDMALTLAPIVYVLGLFLSVLTAWTVCKGQSSVVACVPAVLPVAACFVVTDTLPDKVWLLLFLTAVAVMMFTSATRQTDRRQGRRLAGLVVLPLFLAVAVLFLSVPEQTYYHREKAQAISDFFVGKYTLEQMLDRLAGKVVQLEQKSVNLTAVGPRSDNRTKMLEVTTRYNSGALYLRSSSLDQYTGKQWLDSETPLPDLYWPEPAAGSAYQTDEVVIKTQFAHEMLYLPYYAANLDLSGVTRGYRNSKKLNEYSVTQTYLNHWEAQFGETPALTNEQRVQIASATRLTEDTKKWAIPLAKQIVGDVEDPYYQALYIADYVKNSARYDKNTPRMSSDHKDFAQWFLEESETGYCVHFATAGAVLLKALGIPARYVTGYLVTTQVGTPTDVLAANSHAWVEYWLPGFGWTMLECTPPDNGSEDTPDSTHSTSAPDETLPDTTIAPDDPQKIPGKKGKHSSWNWLWLLLIPALPLILWLQGRLRRGRRIKKCAAGTSNQNALACWLEAEKLSRYLGKTPPEQLRELAEKAKFSPYTLTDAELSQFHEYLRHCVRALQRKPLLTRLYHQWLLVLY